LRIAEKCWRRGTMSRFFLFDFHVPYGIPCLHVQCVSKGTHMVSTVAAIVTFPFVFSKSCQITIRGLYHDTRSQKRAKIRGARQ
jgi:hypothetical protein